MIESALCDVPSEMEFLTKINIARYIIHNLNTNSVIASPDHDEILDTARLAQDATYLLKGYVYAGGGRRGNCGMS